MPLRLDLDFCSVAKDSGGPAGCSAEEWLDASELDDMARARRPGGWWAPNGASFHALQIAAIGSSTP